MNGIGQYLDAREVASLLKLSRAAAYRLMKQCEHVKQGRTIRVSERALQAFLAKRTTPVFDPRSKRSRPRPSRPRTISAPGGDWLRPIVPRTKLRRPDTTEHAKQETDPPTRAARPRPREFLPGTKRIDEETLRSLSIDFGPPTPKLDIDTLGMLDRWRTARDLRDFAHEIRAILRSAELEMSRDGYSERLVKQFLEHADRIDPIALIRDDATRFGLGKLKKRAQTPGQPS